MKEISLLEEKDFKSAMDKTIVPYLESIKTIYSVESSKGGTLYCETLLPKTDFHSVLVIFHGFCEFSLKYDEFVYMALDQGYAVCRFDHRGHGFSVRDKEVEDNLCKVHIDSYQTYVDDAHKIIQDIVKPLAKDKPIFLFAHSMGGAIGAYYLTQHDNVFKAVILNSPMLDITVLGLPLCLALPFSKLIMLFLGKTAYTPVHHDFPEVYVFEKERLCSTSLQRHEYVHSRRLSSKSLQSWGATMKWLCESLSAIKMIKNKKNVQHLTTPILLLQAENDDVVRPKGQDIFVDNVPCAKKIVVKDSDHEMFIGKTELALPWYKQIYSFYEEHIIGENTTI